MPNICMCGAEDGYPHEAFCPYPYFGNNSKLESAWLDAYRARKHAADETKPIAIQHDDIVKLINNLREA